MKRSKAEPKRRNWGRWYGPMGERSRDAIKQAEGDLSRLPLTDNPDADRLAQAYIEGRQDPGLCVIFGWSPPEPQGREIRFLARLILERGVEDPEYAQHVTRWLPQYLDMDPREYRGENTGHLWEIQALWDRFQEDLSLYRREAELERERAELEQQRTELDKERERLAVKQHFTIPTGSWLPLQPFFAAKKGIEPTDIQKGIAQVREYIRFDNPSSSVRIRTLFDGDTEFEARRFEQQMVKVLSPAGLKIAMGLFRAAHDRGRYGYFTLETNEFLDHLGYKRRPTGYHSNTSIGQLYQTIEILKKVQWVGYIRRQLPSGKDEIIMDAEPLILQWGEHGVWHTERGKWVDGGEKVREGVTLQVNPKIYADITEKSLFSWVGRSYLTIPANRHPYAVQLIPFYVVQWREGWAEYQGVYRAKLGVILRGAGIPAPKGNHWARLIDKVKREHDYVVEQGLIKSWRIVDQASKPINDLWEVVIPDGHALKALMPKGGQES